MKRFLASVSVILFLSAFIPAQPGELDLTFNGTGISRLGFDEGDDRGAATAVQADGKIVVAGRTFNGENYDFAVARYNTNGALDSSFDSDGLAHTAVTNDDQATAVIIQTDGKIVVAGYTFDGSVTRIAIVRYNADGSLDDTFDADGIVMTGVGVLSFALSAILDSSGRIIIAGTAFVAGNQDFAVLRYDSNGGLDTTFDTDGIVTTAISADNDTARSVAIQPDGKIVAAGSTASDFAVVRYQTDGTLDTTFDSDGIVLTSIGASSDVASSVVIDTFGIGQKIVVAGYAFNPAGGGTGFDIAVARYDLNGNLDASFDSDGIVTTSITNDADFAYSALIQPSNGKILVAGSNRNGIRRFAAVRYNDDGSPDASFDADGIVINPIQSGDAQARAVAFAPNGKIVLAGHSSKSSEQNLFDDFTVARYNANGSLDASFDGDGIAVTEWKFNPSTARAVALQPDGKIVVVGDAADAASRRFAVMRFNANGTLDTTFSGSGKLRTGIGGTAFAVAVQNDGKIVLAGSVASGFDENIAVVRLNANGSLDTTFNGTGFVSTSISAFDDYALGVAVQPDGKIVVAGYSFTTQQNADFALVRYNANGSLDTTFDADGIVTTAIGSNIDVATSLAIQADGKIVAAGYTFTNFTVLSDFAVVRYNSNGTLDTSFDGDGKVITQIGTSNEQANALALQADGKIVVVGESTIGFATRFAVVRYNTNGGLDNTFGTSGLVTTPVGLSNAGALTTAIQANGKILVGGYAANATSNVFAIVRYNADGTIDFPLAGGQPNIWGTDGTVLIDLSDGSDTVFGLKLDAQGKVVVVGEANESFGIIRLQGDLAPTSAAVSISGRILTADGTGLRNAVVYLTDSAGVTRTTRTGSFGFYGFEGIAAGQTVVIGVNSKLFSFEPRVLTLAEDVAGADFTPSGGEFLK